MITSKQGNPVATFVICLFVVTALSSMAAFADNDTRERNALTTLEVESVIQGMIEPDLDQVSKSGGARLNSSLILMMSHG